MPPHFRTHHDFDAIRAAVAASAANQGNVFRRSDLVRWGIDPEVCPTMLRRRLWTRLRHGVYADTSVSEAADAHDRYLLDVAAAVAALDLPAYAFGISAAVVHDLPIPTGAMRDVHLLRQTGVDQRPLGRRLVRPLGAAPVRFTGHAIDELPRMACLQGIPVVDRQLAAVSASAALTLEWAVAVMDAVCFSDLAAPDRLRALEAAWPLLLGIGTTRRALPHVRSGAQSPLESISRVRFCALGLPEPQLQVPIYDRDGLVGYVDMCWLELGVIGEADGLMKYTDPQALVAEKRREDRLRALGFAVIRWSWSEIMNRPHVVVRRIQAAARWSNTGLQRA